jgi:hypothetical protein
MNQKPRTQDLKELEKLASKFIVDYNKLTPLQKKYWNYREAILVRIKKNEIQHGSLMERLHNIEANL